MEQKLNLMVKTLNSKLEKTREVDIKVYYPDSYKMLN